MNRRLLILRAGSHASNNLIRSLKLGDPSLFVIGCHDNRFVLKKSLADDNYLVPVFGQQEFQRALLRIINAERVDVVIPNTDVDVATISRLRKHLPCRTFLPRKTVIEHCQDKYNLTRLLRRRGIPAPLTYLVNASDDIEKLFRRFAYSHSRLWCRIRKGNGSVGAIPVKNAEQTRAWINYWEEMRDVPPGSFTLSEYLPGRDFTVQCLWKDGALITAKMHERLSYHVAGGGPSGVSSTSALAKMVFEPAVLQVCVKALRALDPRASGVYFIDLKENESGEPCITEINAGRFSNVAIIHDLTGKNNMAVAYVRLAFGESVEIREPRDYGGDCYILRDLDALPAIYQAGELFEGISDARKRPGARGRRAALGKAESPTKFAA